MVLRPVWAEIDLDNLAENVSLLRKHVDNGTKIMAVIKGDAYGAGINGVLETLLANGIDMFGTGVPDEALLVRKLQPDVPVLLFGYTPFESVEVLLKNRISQTIYCWEQAVAIADVAGKNGLSAIVHLKIDTGMGRLGFPATEETVEEIRKIARLPNLVLEGIYTHCPYTNETSGHGARFTYEQFLAFTYVMQRLEKFGLRFNLRHACNSQGIVNYKEMHLDMVRAGIILYGAYPRFQNVLPTKPVLSLKARIAFVKTLPAGSNVSYGHTYTTTKETRVATLPFGYGDGYTRLLTNKGEVLIRGKRVPLIGTICMDQCMADVTDIPGCQIGDEVVLWGKQGKEEITIEEVASRACGFINYEYLIAIQRRVPRVYRKNGETVQTVNHLLGEDPFPA
jgi:alanine racemase